MKKKLLNCGIACLFLLLGSLSVSAYTQSSPVITSPAFVLDTWVRSGKSTLTSMYNTPMCDDAHLEIVNWYSLPMSYASSNDRNFEIRLMDEDPIWSADDIVKYYAGRFDGRKLSSVVKTNTVADTIEPEGENTVELYVTGKLGRVDNDAEQNNGVNLFTYKVHIY